MEANIFDVFKELNIKDDQNKTQHLRLSNTLVGARKVKQGGVIEMAVTADIAIDAAFDHNKNIILLLVVDRAEYEKTKAAACNPSVERSVATDVE